MTHESAQKENLQRSLGLLRTNIQPAMLLVALTAFIEFFLKQQTIRLGFQHNVRI